MSRIAIHFKDYTAVALNKDDREFKMPTKQSI